MSSTLDVDHAYQISLQSVKKCGSGLFLGIGRPVNTILSFIVSNTNLTWNVKLLSMCYIIFCSIPQFMLHYYPESAVYKQFIDFPIITFRNFTDFSTSVMKGSLEAFEHFPRILCIKNTFNACDVKRQPTFRFRLQEKNLQCCLIIIWKNLTMPDFQGTKYK